MVARQYARGVGPVRVPSNLLVLIGIGLLAVFAAGGAIALAGTKTGTVLALLAVVGPLAFYSTLFSPFAFPFTLFALLVPFDNLLSIEAFGTATRLLAIATGGALIIWLLRTRRGIWPDRAVLGWTAFALLSLISMMWAMDPTASVPHVLTFFQLLTLYIAVACMPIDRRTLAMVVAVVIVSGVLAAAYGAWVFHHGTNVSANGRLFLQSDDSMIDPNHFAAALIVPFCLALIGLVNTRSFLMRILFVAALIVMGGGVAVAGSRGGLLAVAAAFVYIFIRSKRRLLIGGLGIASMGVALAAYGNVLSRFSNAASTGGAGRADIWKVGLDAFRQHFWIGAGASNFPLAFDQSFLTVTENYYTHWHRAPHNILISTGVELGIVGLAVFLGAWWLQFRAMRGIPQGDPLYSLRTAMEAGLIGLFFAGMFLDIMYSKYVWLAFILCALIRNAAYCTRKANQTS